MRLHKGPESRPVKSEEAYLQRALSALDQARNSDGRPLGKLFADTARNSFLAMLFIGACIMFFSVIMQVINATGLLNPVRTGLGYLLKLCLDANLTEQCSMASSRTTMGAQAANSAASLGAASPPPA